MPDVDQFLAGVVEPTPPAPPGASTDVDQFLSSIAEPRAGASVPATSVSSAPPELTGASRYLGLGRYVVGRGLALGLGTPGEVENLVNTYGVQPTTRFFGGQGEALDPYTGSYPTFFPRVSNILGAESQLGLLPGAELNPGAGPYPEAEKLGTAAGIGLVSAIPSILAGAPPIQTATAGGLGGLAGEVASEALPGNPLAPPLAGLAAGIGTSVAASALASTNLRSIASSLGSSSTVQQAGEAMQQSARSWLSSTLPSKLAAAWAPVDAAIPPATVTPLTNFSSALSGITRSAGTLQPLVDALTSTGPKRLEQILNNLPSTQTTWGDVKQLRSAVGDAMANPQTVKDIPQTNLAHLYAALTQDMQQTAASVGASDVFNAANAESTRLYNLAEGPVAKVVSGPKADLANDPAPEAVASRFLSGGKRGATDLAALRTEIPSAVDELAAAHLTSTPQNWAKLAPEAQAALIPDKAVRDRVSSLVATTAGTPVNLADQHLLSSLVGGEIMAPIGEHLLNYAYPGLMSNDLVQAGGLAAGALAPVLARNAARIWENPASLRTPLVGTMAGSNPLWPSTVAPTTP